MTPLKYQQGVMRTMNAQVTPKESLTNWALGLSGETGEVVEHVKKYVFHGKDLKISEVKKELGDVLWYVSAFANTLGLSLEEIMEANIDKLKARYPDGFEERKN